MTIRECALTGLAVAILVARGVAAQSAPQQPVSITAVGVWRGTSVCLVRPSACRDEVVVYRITRTKAADSLIVDGRKIVNGKEQEMGVLNCSFAAPDRSLTCLIPQATWQFRIRNDSLVGELRLANNTKFRDVRARRSHDRSP